MNNQDRLDKAVSVIHNQFELKLQNDTPLSFEDIKGILEKDHALTGLSYLGMRLEVFRKAILSNPPKDIADEYDYVLETFVAPVIFFSSHVLEAYNWFNSRHKEDLTIEMKYYEDGTYNCEEKQELIDKANELIQATLILKIYKQNLPDKIKWIEEYIYTTTEYPVLTSAFQDIGRKLINKNLHPEYKILKKHIKHRLTSIKKEHEVVSIQKALPVQTFQRKTADVKDVSQPTENKGSAFQQSIDTEFDLKKLRAKHYVLAYIFECYAKGETLPNGNKTKLQRIGDERMGAGKGNTFYKNFNSIVIKDMNAENILIEIGGKNWRKAIIGLSKAPEIVEKYLQSKQL